MTLLPDKAIGQLRAASGRRSRRWIPKGHPNVHDGDGRCADAETVGAIGGIPGARGVTAEEIREPQLVDHSRREHARQRCQALVHIYGAARPTRRQYVGCSHKAAAVVMRMAYEDGVAGAGAHVDARAGEIPHIRRRKYSVQPSKRGIGRLDRHHATLVVSLVAGEEERPVAANRSPHGRTELASPEEGVWIPGVAAQTRICREVVIAVEPKSAATIVVAARPRDNIDGAVACQAGGRIEINGRNLKL